ncbi:RNA polymerase sigma factor FliA [Myxococcota bacterium]|nr:RNA polymerase sigma factor FliA [Myxococcota bacterium]MBU1430930.1 RNA polymerase sigma factor FliA [Myxococcota bacterium]MBU1900715.1 RNA polymerase sigma factor FliA [Myxococcota bacterium]
MNRGIRAYQQAAKTPQQRREDLVRQYAPLVKRVAYRMIHRLPSSVDLEDLISVGTMGLLHAIDHFDASKGTRFEAFAEFRIKGAMLDELRAYDFMSRSARSRSNLVERTQQQLSVRLGRTPTPAEIADEVGFSVEEVNRLLAIEGQVQMVTVEDLVSVASEQTDEPWALLTQASPDDPFGHTFLQELRDHLVEALEELPERLRLVMALYYNEGLNFKEIGMVLDRTESRVSQMHSDAIKKLKFKLKKTH